MTTERSEIPNTPDPLNEPGLGADEGVSVEDIQNEISAMLDTAENQKYSTPSSEEETPEPAVESGEEQPEEQPEEQQTEAIQDESETSEPAKAEAPEKKAGFTDVERKALKAGWIPPDRVPEGEKAYSAEEFMIRGDYMGTIHKLKRRLTKTEKGNARMMEILEKQNRKMEEAERRPYQEAREQAILQGDIETVNKMDAELAKLAAAATPQENPAQQFERENIAWFNTSTPRTTEMRQFAINVEQMARKDHPNMPYSDVLSVVKEAVEYKYKDFFDILNGTTSPAAVPDPKKYVEKPAPKAEKPYVAAHKTVESGDIVPPRPTKKPQGFADLPAAMQTVVRNVVESMPKSGENMQAALDKYALEIIKGGL